MMHIVYALHIQKFQSQEKSSVFIKVKSVFEKEKKYHISQETLSINFPQSVHYSLGYTIREQSEIRFPAS